MDTNIGYCYDTWRFLSRVMLGQIRSACVFFMLACSLSLMSSTECLLKTMSSSLNGLS